MTKNGKQFSPSSLSLLIYRTAMRAAGKIDESALLSCFLIGRPTYFWHPQKEAAVRLGPQEGTFPRADRIVQTFVHNGEFFRPANTSSSSTLTSREERESGKGEGKEPLCDSETEKGVKTKTSSYSSLRHLVRRAFRREVRDGVPNEAGFWSDEGFALLRYLHSVLKLKRQIDESRPVSGRYFQYRCQNFHTGVEREGATEKRPVFRRQSGEMPESDAEKSGGASDSDRDGEMFQEGGRAEGHSLVGDQPGHSGRNSASSSLQDRTPSRSSVQIPPLPLVPAPPVSPVSFHRDRDRERESVLHRLTVVDSRGALLVAHPATGACSHVMDLSVVLLTHVAPSPPGGFSSSGFARKRGYPSIRGLVLNRPFTDDTDGSIGLLREFLDFSPPHTNTRHAHSNQQQGWTPNYRQFFRESTQSPRRDLWRPSPRGRMFEKERERKQYGWGGRLNARGEGRYWSGSGTVLGVDRDALYMLERFFGESPVFRGGVVEKPSRDENLCFIHRVPACGGEELLPGLFLNGCLRTGAAEIDQGRASSSDFRFFWGHLAWHPVQLQLDVLNGLWFVAEDRGEGGTLSEKKDSRDTSSKESPLSAKRAPQAISTPQPPRPLAYGDNVETQREPVQPPRPPAGPSTPSPVQQPSFSSETEGEGEGQRSVASQFALMSIDSLWRDALHVAALREEITALYSNSSKRNHSSASSRRDRDKHTAAAATPSSSSGSLSPFSSSFSSLQPDRDTDGDDVSLGRKERDSSKSGEADSERVMTVSTERADKQGNPSSSTTSPRSRVPPPPVAAPAPPQDSPSGGTGRGPGTHHEGRRPREREKEKVVPMEESDRERRKRAEEKYRRAAFLLQEKGERWTRRFWASAMESLAEGGGGDPFRQLAQFPQWEGANRAVQDHLNHHIQRCFYR
uniref:Uncharacterized protein n=1 Tax=Chromera velia CCMP2878 TaxID=1169474 RepID=A0A0G4I1C9_9ALVE|eukprot:Cvel_10126.t1-p1 / transcript=Cvel_10126.t1 / gene=Cvel_10126 / organism=Chromera_velia_CCMP2878 / gene_product=hypothetical protein / transcript_product=hypothetical protein / location=Cvel_scaffold603:69969-75859(+) / protein_length=907 / sequence_SO=supercontig / SO=protein_coding / is_pseudo=false